MRIFNIAPFNIWDLGYGKGRPSTYLPLKGLVEKGHDVWWFTSAEEVEEGEDTKLQQEGIKVVRFKVPFLSVGSPSVVLAKYYFLCFFLFSFFNILKVARHAKPDLLYAHQRTAGFPAFFLSKILKIPFVVKSYGLCISPDVLNNFWYWGGYAFKLPASLFIFVNDGTQLDKIALSQGTPREKIAFLVNGIDKNLKQIADPSFRDEIASNDEKIVLSVCRLEPVKQVDLLVKSVPEISKNNPKIKFVIVGDGEEKENLVDLSKKLGVSDFVRFEGAVSNHKIPDYLCAADVLVSLNRLSNVVNPVIEAMCCGTPVIASNTGTTSHLIKHNENGILLEPVEIDKLPKVILNLLMDEELRRSIGKKGREFIMENWLSWEERVAQEVELIENVVEKSSL